MSGRARHLTRRRFFLGAAGLATAGAAAGIAVGETAGSGTPSVAVPRVALSPLAPALPARQHAWNATLARDRDGNPVSPRFDRLLFFDVQGSPSPAYARLLEASLRTLEHRYRWSPGGLLFTAGWGPDYFERVLHVASPIPRATAMSLFEQPAIDDYHLCLHLASDDERRLADVEAALVHGVPLPGAAGPLKITDILRWRETRTGFVGAGLPAAHQDTGGIPAGRPVAASAPLFMGFKSNYKRNQASEDAVTVLTGPFAGGTTMAVSYMRLRLESWYGNLSIRERVARMYAPQVTPQQANAFTTDAASDPNRLGEAISRYGVIGHAQTSARARRNGKPLIARRDFNTVDGGQAGLHFVCIQRSIEDFVTTRKAMNATSAQLQNPSITDTVNNGINEFMFVLKRANYILPARAQRAFPLLPGRSRALV
ncbi:MAG TPA: hypothetical protein VG325_16840 [Solirubrobacteraceae bacterium]|nr:hypothetical protein [Solirubrobacteraceae bacterium]